MESLRHGYEEPGDIQDIRLVVDTIPTLAWSAGPDGSADFFNQRWVDYTGLSAKQALGWGWEVAIHPDDQQRILETFREALNSVKRLEVEGRFRRFDGEFRWFLFRASPLCDESGKVVKWYGTNTDIEDRKRAEDALRSHEQNLRLLVDTIPGHVVTTTPAGEIELLNRRVLEYFDKTPEELVNWRTSDAIHPDDLALTIAALTRSIQTGEPYEVEHRLRRADGAYRWFHTRGLALRDKEGRIVRWYYLPIDVDDRKHAEDALRKSEERWRSVFENSAIGVTLTDLNGRFLATNHVYQTIVGYTEEELRAVNFLDLTHEDYRQANWALITELVEGKRQQFQIEKKYRRKDGSLIWVSINASLVPGTERVPRFIMALSEDITERKRAEQALRRSEGYLAEAQRLANTGSWAYNPAAEKCIYWSDEMLRIFGLDPQRNLPDREEFLRLIHPEDRDRFNERIEKSRREKSDFVQDYRVVLTDGTIKHIHGIGHPVLDETGNIIEYVGTDVDVTERKLAEEKLQRSEAFLAQGQTLSHTGSFGWSVLSGEIYWSEETYNIFQYDRAVKPTLELVFQRIHPDDRDLVQQIIDDASEERAYLDFEHRLMMPDGSVKHLHVMARALTPSSGKLEFVGAVTDITAAKQAEEKLRRNEWNLLEAQRLGRSGSWSLDVSSGTVTNTPEIWRAFGVKPGEDCSSPDFWFNRIHPQDRKRVRDLFERCLVEKTDYEAEFRVLRPDGTISYQHAIGRPIVNEAGNLVEFVGTSIDVTEQCEARAALQTAFEQIKAEETELRRMTDAIASFIYVFRPDGTALYANQVVLDYTGLTLEDVQREDFPARIFHPEDVERLLEKRHDALTRGKPFELEKRELGKDGKYRWFLVHYNPLRDDQGHIIRWYATGTDIEDRKQAEERMRDENVALREQIDQAFMFEEIVGASPALQSVLSNIVKVAPTDSTVLITGETGTGKELIARAIHKHSQRSGQAFISVNCASIPSSLIASELFGHEKGAFTGALQRRQGRFEMAHSGTIFLDEVGELPTETQIALLRVLQERQFERVGGNRIISTDVRVIAATNRDLTAAIAAGTFRADLFYRLNVFPIEVPPLRKRKEDIPMLVEYFVKRYAEKMGKQIRKIDNNTLELCQSYPWPGNIRELQNIVERSVILCGGDTFWIEKAWLASVQPPRQELAGPLPDTLQNQEKEMIEAALAESKGKVAGPEGAAAKLGIPRSTLDSKIKQLNIKKHKFIAER
jgi:PAS domain S-box-containing protein